MDSCQKLDTTLEEFTLILDWLQAAHNDGFEFNLVYPNRNKFANQLKKGVVLPLPQLVIIQLKNSAGAKMLIKV